MFPSSSPQPIDIGFTGAIVSALNRVFEKAQNAVAIVAVVLGGVNTPLGCDRVGPAWRIMIGKAMDVVALLAEGSGGGRTCQPCAHYDDGVFAAIRRVHQLHFVAALVPLLLNWTCGYPCFQHLCAPFN